MKKRFLKISVVYCLLACIAAGLIPNITIASQIITETPTVEAESTEITMEDVIAGMATMKDLYPELDESSVPDIIGYEKAVSNNHIARLYEDEGESLNNVIFLNADGTKTLYMFDHPVKYTDENGDIKDISLEIADSNAGLMSFETAENSTMTRFYTDFSNGISLSGNNTYVSLAPILFNVNESAVLSFEQNAVSSQSSSARRIDKNTIAYTYDEKTSIEYSLTYTGFKEDIVVKEYTGQTQYDFTLYTNGLELKKINGSYVLVDSLNVVKAIIGDIIVFTADGKNNTFGSLTYETVLEKQEYILTIVLDSEYLSDEKTKYPIRIDPTVEINYSSGTDAISDVTIYSTGGSSAISPLSIGANENCYYRVLMKFPGLDISSLGANAQITDAYVELQDLTQGAESLLVLCYVFAGYYWNEDTVTWNNVNPDAYSTFLAGQPINYDSGVTQVTPHRYRFDITDAVNGWKAGVYSQDKGIMFKALGEVETGTIPYNLKQFGSYNQGSVGPTLSITYTNNNSITDGIYYLNNKYSGDYLQYSSTSLSIESGLVASLGDSVRWKIVGIENGYVIRHSSDTSKFLAVSSDTSSSALEMVTVDNSEIPSRCIWSISTLGEGGCHVRNNYNLKYLYTYGNYLSLATDTGESGSIVHKTRVWRIVTPNKLSGKELNSFSIDDYYLFSGETVKPNIEKLPYSAAWSDFADFTYTGYSSRITYDVTTGYFTAGYSAEFYSATITATHKVTNLQTTFYIVVNPKANLIGVASSGHDHTSALTEVQTHVENIGYTNAYVRSGSFTSDQIDSFLDDNGSSIFVSRSHGNVVVDSDGNQLGTFVSISEDSGYYSNGSIGSLDLSNMKLIMFIACYSGKGGEGGANLPTVAVEQGAMTAIGFTEEINCYIANSWTTDFFELMEEGNTVSEACKTLAERTKYKGTNMTSYVICGNKDTTLS